MKEKKEKKRKYVIVLLLLLIVICFSVGFALLSTKLDIQGTSEIGKLSWDIHFDNIKVTKGSVTATKAPSILGSTAVTYAIMLPTPGDFYEFTVDVMNRGGLDAKVEATPMVLGVSSLQKKYVNYTVTYQDGTAIQAGDKLPVDGTKTFKVRVEYGKNVAAEDLPTIEQSLSLTFSVTYIQA